jgi:hypothetical protein
MKTRQHHELIVADQHAQATLDRKRQHLERAQRYLDECDDSRRADAERRVERISREMQVARVEADAATDALIAYEHAQRWTVSTPEIVVVDAPDVSQCCNAPTSVDEHAVVYCKRCYRPV